MNGTALTPRASAEPIARAYPPNPEFDELLTDERPLEISSLVPFSRLPAVIGDLEQLTAPASPTIVREEVAKLLGAFASVMRNVAQFDVQIMALGLQEDLAPYPPDILATTVRRARREIRFLTNAAVVSIADGYLGQRRYALRRARAMVTEHERRRRDAARRAEIERDRPAITRGFAQLREILARGQTAEPEHQAAQRKRRSRTAKSTARGRGAGSAQGLAP